jgi:hypothetical protein
VLLPYSVQQLRNGVVIGQLVSIMRCIEDGISMTDVVIELLDRRFPATKNPK